MLAFTYVLNFAFLSLQENPKLFQVLLYHDNHPITEADVQ